MLRIEHINNWPDKELVKILERVGSVYIVYKQIFNVKVYINSFTTIDQASIWIGKQ